MDRVRRRACSGFKDRRGNDYLLGPTHEELFALTVKGEYSSYKDFPLMLYQIQNKYRDEARPRAGILRGREFIMKDSYSFDIDDDGLKAAYHAHREAYQRIFDRLGVRLRHRVRRVGGDGRHVRPRSSWPKARSVRTPSCVAWNPVTPPTSRRWSPRAPEAAADRRAARGGGPRHARHTPTIATLVEWANGADLGRSVTAADTLKNVVLKVRQPGERLGAVGCRRAG